MTQNADSVRLCGELLYEDGSAIAYCTEPWGTEHSHSDAPMKGAPLADGEHAAEVLVMGGEVVQVNLLVYGPAQNDGSESKDA